MLYHKVSTFTGILFPTDFAPKVKYICSLLAARLWKENVKSLTQTFLTYAVGTPHDNFTIERGMGLFIYTAKASI